MDKDEIIINVDDILSKGIGSTENKKVDSNISKFEEIQLSNGIHGDVFLTNLGEEILANIKVNTEIKQICSRCAKDYDQNINLRYNQIYKFNPDEDSFLITADKKIDLWPSIRQEIIINTPMKPLCKPDCKGLNY
jgi:uncharacterized protein